MLTQSYFVIPKNLKRLAKAIFISYAKERADLKTIQFESDVLTNDKLVIVREKSPRRVAQGHKLAALMKKRKEEILQRTFHITF